MAGKVFYGLRVIAGKGWNTGKMAGVKVLDFGAMVVGTGKSIAETTVETGNWVLGKVFDTGKFVVDMALDVGWKWSGKVIEYGLIYSRDFAVMAYKGHIEGKRTTCKVCITYLGSNGTGVEYRNRRATEEDSGSTSVTAKF